jgi:hypothetical protein
MYSCIHVNENHCEIILRFHDPELPKPSGKQPKHQPWWNTEPTMQEGIQLPELLQKIRALREAGLRAEHVAFSFMKRRVRTRSVPVVDG